MYAKNLIRLCEKHDDCVFLCFTNGTLIDEAFADDMLRVGNFIPAISLEELYAGRKRRVSGSDADAGTEDGNLSQNPRLSCDETAVCDGLPE